MRNNQLVREEIANTALWAAREARNGKTDFVLPSAISVSAQAWIESHQEDFWDIVRQTVQFLDEKTDERILEGGSGKRPAIRIPKDLVGTQFPDDRTRTLRPGGHVRER